MIYSVTVTNHLGESITLELTRPEQSGLVIKSIDGLGPAKATINNTELATSDVSLFNSARLETRNIVFDLLYMEKETIEDARQNTYKYFPIKKKIHLDFVTDNRQCGCDGYVESNEPNIFDKESGTQISIICPNPYFYLTDSIKTETFYGADPKFSFPFSNDSLTENLIEFSNIDHYGTQEIIYEGDYEAGLVITVHASGEVVNPVFYNVTTKESVGLNTNKIAELTGKGFIAGDEIIITTTKGSKSIQLYRNGQFYNILSSISSISTWFSLEPGKNAFAIDAEEGLYNMDVTYEYMVAYEGI